MLHLYTVFGGHAPMWAGDFEDMDVMLEVASGFLKTFPTDNLYFTED